MLYVSISFKDIRMFHSAKQSINLVFIITIPYKSSGFEENGASMT